MRIPPDAVPGYIAALRETNASGGGKERTNPILQWKPKSPPSAHTRKDGEVPFESVQEKPDVGEVPGDFSDICYTSLETQLEQFVTSTDDWSQVGSPQASIPRRDRSILTERHTAMEHWRDQSQPRLRAIIEPWAMYFVGNADKPIAIDLLTDAVTELSTSGSTNHRLSALDALAYISHMKDAHHRDTQYYWGKVHRRGDFTARELTVACFQFQVIDFVDSIPLQEAPVRSTWNVEYAERERGICVLLHLSVGMLWEESGRPKRATGRGRVFAMAHELRRLGLKNALLSQDALQEDTSLESMIVRIRAHDACRPARARDRRTLGFFRPLSCWA